MGLLDRIEGKSEEPIKTSLDLFREVYGGWKVNSGQAVNWKTALQVSTVLACARVIAEGISQVPLKILRESPDGRKREPAKDHPLYSLLHRKPNFYQTSFEYRETLGLHVVLTGAHYSFVNRMPGTGKILSLLPFEPQHVTVKRDKRTRELEYEVRPEEGEPMTFPAASIWHVRGPSWNSYLALEPVKLAREAIGLAMATEEHHAKLHKNGARVGGLISVDGNLTDQQYQQMRKWLEKYFEGTSNEHAGRTMLLDRAAKFTAAEQSGVDSQHLETRRYQVEEICRHLRVMPIMVGYSDKASTYASAEQMFLAHLVHTLSPWYERIEQSIDTNLLTVKDQEAGIYAKFIEEGLLRGAMKDTAEYLARMTLSGIMTRNEARSKLDMDALDGLDDPLTPVNTFVGTPPESRGEPDDPAPKGRPPMVLQLTSFEKAVADVASALKSVHAGQEAVAGATQSMAAAQGEMAGAVTELAQGATRSAAAAARSAASIEVGFAALVREQRKPRKAVFDKDGNPIGSEPVESLT